MGGKIYLKISKTGKHLFLCVDQQAPSAMPRAICMHRLEESCIRSKSAWTGLWMRRGKYSVGFQIVNIALKMVNTCGKSGLLVRINSFQLKNFYVSRPLVIWLNWSPTFMKDIHLAKQARWGSLWPIIKVCCFVPLFAYMLGVFFFLNLPPIF